MLDERLSKARERAGLKQVELAVALGDRYDQTMISAVECGRSALRFDGAVKAAQTLSVSLDYLAGLTDDPTPSAQLAARLSELEAAASNDASTAPQPHARVTRPYARNVLAAAGDGAPVFEESDVFEIGIAPSALKPWARPDAIVFIRAAGDSMLPDIRDGDLLAVDSSRVEPISGQRFVLRTDAGTVVKRLRRRGRRWHLVSDNTAYEPRPVAEDDCIVGQVAWVGPPSGTDAP